MVGSEFEISAPAPTSTPAKSVGQEFQRDIGQSKPWSPTDPLGKSNIPSNVKVETDFHVVPKTTDTSAFYQQGVAPIKAMQEAMIKLAYDVGNHQIHDNPDAGAFMNFLVTNYANQATPTGKQTIQTKTDIGQPLAQQVAKTPNDNFKGFINSMSQLGTVGTRNKADGIWGEMTNNALKQIYSLANLLLKVQQDMGFDVSAYETIINELQSNIPATTKGININDLIQRANIITPDLLKLRALYDNFREKVLNDPNYAAQIKQEKPLLAATTSEKQKPFPVQGYEQHKNTPVYIRINGQGLYIYPSNLDSVENFKKFLAIPTNLAAFKLSPEEQKLLDKNDSNTINKMLITVIKDLEESSIK